MGLSPSRSGNHSHEDASTRHRHWLEALKLGSITAAVAAIQWLRFSLLAIEDSRTSEGHRTQRRGSYERQQQKGLIAGLSPETRKALVGLIDYQLTPVLVDQWRLGLVKVVLDPGEGPVIPDEDPQVRAAILESLKTFEDAQEQRQTFREGQRPARYGNQQQRPQGTGWREDRRPLPSTSNAAAPASQASPSSKVHDLAGPSSSAPPLYPVVELPSAPPLPLDAMENAGPSSLATCASPVDAAGDCGICMDAQVEVEIDGCGHQLCRECTKAICCLEGRAPQCPFCRGPMRGVSAIKL